MEGGRAVKHRMSPAGGPPSDTEPRVIHASSSKDQDRLLPIANVGRIMKRSLPANAKISKEAKETVQECVSEFISFVTGEASDRCQRERRKTVNGDDLLWAMTTLGFDNYVGPLKAYLNGCRETEGEKDSMSAAMQGTDRRGEYSEDPNPDPNPIPVGLSGDGLPGVYRGFAGRVLGYGIGGSGEFMECNGFSFGNIK